MTIISRLVDQKVCNSYELLASSFELDLSLKQLVANSSQLVACNLKESVDNSVETE